MIVWIDFHKYLHNIGYQELLSLWIGSRLLVVISVFDWAFAGVLTQAHGAVVEHSKITMHFHGMNRFETFQNTATDLRILSQNLDNLFGLKIFKISPSR